MQRSLALQATGMLARLLASRPLCIHVDPPSNLTGVLPARPPRSAQVSDTLAGLPLAGDAGAPSLYVQVSVSVPWVLCLRSSGRPSVAGRR